MGEGSKKLNECEESPKFVGFHEFFQNAAFSLPEDAPFISAQNSHPWLHPSPGESPKPTFI